MAPEKDEPADDAPESVPRLPVVPEEVNGDDVPVKDTLELGIDEDESGEDGPPGFDDEIVVIGELGGVKDVPTSVKEAPMDVNVAVDVPVVIA